MKWLSKVLLCAFFLFFVLTFVFLFVFSLVSASWLSLRVCAFLYRYA